VPWRPLPIRFGVENSLVGDIQRALRRRGAHDLVVDSHFGAATDAALRDFQRRHDLAPDGVAGAQTLRALGLGAGEAQAPDASPDDPAGG
jgi:peptidoglycan hydrolase-like protein with peptidoglycan-binding domain